MTIPLMQRSDRAVSGVGIGLREPHIAQLVQDPALVPWVELLADNHFAAGGLVAAQVAAVRERFPLTLHCVGMNIGGVEPLDQAYLARVNDLMARTGPAWVSDHLCFTRYASHHYHDLLPLPYSEEALAHVARRIREIQDALATTLVVENVSAYVIAAESIMSEAQFLAALHEATGCEILLDVNNLYVSEVNLGVDARGFMAEIPADAVREIHLAGYQDKGEYLVDAHNNPVSSSVWDLFGDALAIWPEVPVLIEWDNDIPPLEVLLDEMALSERMRSQYNIMAAYEP